MTGKQVRPKRLPVVSGVLRVKAWPVLERAVEEGVAYGWQRAHKHTDNPGEDLILDDIGQAVMSSICEAFEIDEPED
jgi:hypothetical protein